jgi:thioester reductase-like protein
MQARHAILLTGATGLVGRFLLRDLLASGRRVAVLARGGDKPAAERVAGLLALWGEALGRELPRPVVLGGDLTAARLGLGPADRKWLAAHVRTVVHVAANVSYQETADGEPWRTNVLGTRRLLEFCRDIGLAEYHHFSTAFLCGDRTGVVREDELDCGRGGANAYERSKFAAEQLVRQAAGLRATVYRPSVVVGDSATGYTSTYHHFYRFLELAVRLASPGASRAGRKHRLNVRLPLTGEETQNLVPVDWVSRAVVALLRRPEWHGRTFHLVARRPVRLRAVQAILEDLLHIEGIRWAGPDGLGEPTSLERLILEQFRDYWSYLHGNLVFDGRNTRAALPDLPPPPFDRALVARLVDFARADQWGRGRVRCPIPAGQGEEDCGHYLERVLPAQAERHPLARVLPPDLVFVVDVRGPGGGQWSCRTAPGGKLRVLRGATEAAVTYRTDVATFRALIRGRESLQNAFFEGRIDLEGDTETALKLGGLIEQFLAATAANAPRSSEVVHAPSRR